MPSESGVTSSSSWSSTVPAENAGLHRRAEGDHFIGIEIGMRAGAEEHFDGAAHHRDAGGAADQHDFIDLLRSDAGVLHAIAAGAEGAVDDVANQVLEQLAGDLPR